MPFTHFVTTKRTWQPSASMPSTPSWIPGSSSSAASLCFATFALCWAAASAKEPWRLQHTALYLYPLTVTYRATAQMWQFHRPTRTPVYPSDLPEKLWWTGGWDISMSDKTLEQSCDCDSHKELLTFTHRHKARRLWKEASVSMEIFHSFSMNLLWGENGCTSSYTSTDWWKLFQSCKESRAIKQTAL